VNRNPNFCSRRAGQRCFPKLSSSVLPRSLIPFHSSAISSITSFVDEFHKYNRMPFVGGIVPRARGRRVNVYTTIRDRIDSVHRAYRPVDGVLYMTTTICSMSTDWKCNCLGRSFFRSTLSDRPSARPLPIPRLLEQGIPRR